MNTATIATPIINQSNQKMNNQSNSQTLEGDLFALLFQNSLGNSQKEVELAANLTTNLTTNSNLKEELFALMHQSTMNNLEVVSLEEQTVDPTVDQSLGLFEEYQFNTNSAQIIDSLLASLQTILNNSTNLVEDVRNWYNSLPNEQRSSFDRLFTQWQLQENQNPNVKNELADLVKNYLKDNTLVEKFQQIIQTELGRSARSSLINEHHEQSLSNTHSFEKNLMKEKQFPVLLERIDLSSYRGESNLATQGKLEQLGSTNMNSGIENETSNVDIRQLQSSYTNALIATKETSNNVSGSAANTVHYEMNGKDISSELGKLIMKNIKLPNGVTEMKIQLHPHELGKIDIKLTSQQGNLTAMFLADTAVGKEMLENSLHILRHSLIQQGVQVDRIEVISSASSNALNGDHLEQNLPFHQQNHSSQHQKGKSTYHDEEQYFLPDDSIDEQMEIEEMNFMLETRGINYMV